MNIDPEALLAALRTAGGEGLSLKQLAGQLRLGQSRKQPLRRALSHLLKEGRASYDGRAYREVARPRRAPATMVEAARRRRAGKEADPPARKPGAAGAGAAPLQAQGDALAAPPSPP